MSASMSKIFEDVIEEVSIEEIRKDRNKKIDDLLDGEDKQ